MKQSKAFLLLIFLVVVGTGLVGCAAGPTATASAKTLPEMLRDAGFKAFAADTPEKMAYLKTCPKETLITHEKKGALCYAFPDPAAKSIYLGDDAAYWRFKKALENQEQRLQEKRIESDPEFWSLWGASQGGG